MVNGHIFIHFLCAYKHTDAVCCIFCKNHVITARVYRGFRSFLLFEVSEVNYLQGWKSCFWSIFPAGHCWNPIIYFRRTLWGVYIPVNILEFISDRLSLAQHASSVLQLKTHLLFSSCLFQSQYRGPKFLESNFFSDENELFCKICSWNNQALADQEISKVGDYLMIQVNHFLFLIKQWQRILVRSLAPPL